MSIYGRMRHYLSKIFYNNPNCLALDEINWEFINLERLSRMKNAIKFLLLQTL